MYRRLKNLATGKGNRKMGKMEKRVERSEEFMKTN